MHADAIMYEDRRHIVGHGPVGSNDIGTMVSVSRELGLTDLVPTVVAVRDQSLALMSSLYSGDLYEVEMLTLAEVDDRALIRRVVTFDGIDLGSAVDELDDQYLTTLQSSVRDSFLVQRRFLRAFIGMDATTAASLMSTAFTLVDHRPIGLGTLDRESALAGFPIVSDRSSTSVHYAAEILAISARGAVVHNVEKEVNTSGGSIDNEVLVVTTVSNDAIDRIEFFAPEARERALERFDELMAVGRS